MDEESAGEERKKVKIRPRGRLPFDDDFDENGFPADRNLPVSENPLSARLPSGRKPFGNDGSDEEPADPASPDKKQRTKRRRRRTHKGPSALARAASELASTARHVWALAWGINVPLLAALLCAAVVGTAVAVHTYFSGIDAGMAQSLRAATMERIEVPAEFTTALDEAMVAIRDGHSDKAIKTLEKLSQTFPNIGSLSYITAFAAVQDGDLDLAERKIDESIKKREKVSDSLALKAIVEAQRTRTPGFKALGDPKTRIEVLLRQAILADTSNPFPRLELGNLLRRQKRGEEALVELKAARARLNPADSQMMADTTIALLTLELMPDDKLPAPSETTPSDNPALFAEAYLALRNGNTDRSAALLKTAKDRMPPDLFNYALRDPAFRNARTEPRLAEFFP